MLVVHNRGAVTPRTATRQVLLLAFASMGRGENINFDNSTVGTLPAGWVFTMTHTGGPPKWEVRKDDSAPSGPNVLAQVSVDRTAGRFPLAIWDHASLKDGTVSVKFKAVSGTVDQGAGLVWRYRDPNNYYIVRANALEDNIVLYRVQNGERLSLAPKGAVPNAYGVNHKVPNQTYPSLTSDFHRTTFTV